MPMPKASYTLNTAKLDAILRKMPAEGDRMVEIAARNVEKRAKVSMVGGGSPHQPSAPGKPPHRDTANLANSIHVTKPHAGARDVGDGVEYGIHLEFGTSRMEPRPWLGPAVEAERKPFVEACEELFEA